MGSMSIWHWAIVAVLALLLFGGRGKLSGLMGDAAKGIRAFKDGLKDDDKKDGKADMVAFGRLYVSNPDLVARIAEQLGATLQRDTGEGPMTTRFTLRWTRPAP